MILKNLLLVILAGLGVYMLYFGISKNMLPPGITGLGFLVITMLFLNKGNK